MLASLKTRVGRALHLAAIRGILDTPPLTIVDAPLRILSMVSHRDFLLYLAAVKSLYRQIGEGRIVIVNDGSLTAEEQAALTHHLGGPTILRMQDCDTGPCPRGGTWERLLDIVDLTPDYYVIQADSDTLALGPMPEVVDAYRQNRSFVLPSSHRGMAFRTLAEVGEMSKDFDSAHVQAQAEKAFAKMPDADKRFYVRGCSGFSGFARGAYSRQMIEEFSQQVASLIGDAKWREWGSEQVSSNYLVSNSKDPVLLPFPRYANNYPWVDPAQAQFLHFIGDYRFYRARYARLTRRQIAAMG